MSDYPKTSSVVEVIFIDGEVKNYVISAGAGIGGYLIRDAAETGILNLYNLDESYAIPVDRIREWKIVNRPTLTEESEQ